MARHIQELTDNEIANIDSYFKHLDKTKMWVVKYRGEIIPVGKVRMFKHKKVARNKFRDVIDGLIFHIDYNAWRHNKSSEYSFLQSFIKDHKSSPAFNNNTELLAEEIIDLLIEKGIVEITQN